MSGATDIYIYIEREREEYWDFESCPGTLHLLLKYEPLKQSGMVLCMVLLEATCY